jgi:hypothetical protein
MVNTFILYTKEDYKNPIAMTAHALDTKRRTKQVVEGVQLVAIIERAEEYELELARIRRKNQGKPKEEQGKQRKREKYFFLMR